MQNNYPELLSLFPELTIKELGSTESNLQFFTSNSLQFPVKRDTNISLMTSPLIIRA